MTQCHGKILNNYTIVEKCQIRQTIKNFKFNYGNNKHNK